MAESLQWPTLLSTQTGVPNTFPGDWNACVRTDRDHPPNPYTIPSPSPAPEVMVTNGKFSAIISSYAFTYHLEIDTILYPQETGCYPAQVTTHQVPQRSITLIDVSPQSPRPGMLSMEDYNLVAITCLDYNPIIISSWTCNLSIELQLNYNFIVVAKVNFNRITI
jgi:hypothetical protein